MSKVFVSYKRADKDKVFPFVHKMESELGIKFWVDLEDIDGDSQFTSVIIDAIVECEVFYSCIRRLMRKTQIPKMTIRCVNYALLMNCASA